MVPFRFAFDEIITREVPTTPKLKLKDSAIGLASAVLDQAAERRRSEKAAAAEAASKKKAAQVKPAAVANLALLVGVPGVTLALIVLLLAGGL